MKILKKTATIFCASILFNFSLKSQIIHQSNYENQEKSTIDFRKALADFDVKKALSIMDSLQILESERAGYLRKLRLEHIKRKGGSEAFLKGGQKKFTHTKPHSSGSAKGIYCTNAGFENFDFTNWLPFYGTYGAAGATAGLFSSVPNAGVFDPGARHTILTTPPLNDNPSLGPVVGYDEIAINSVTGLAEIPYLPPASSGVTARLGNANTGAEAERLIYPISVTPFNTNFYYQFAIVLQDPGHLVTEQPYFQITVKDSLGNPVGGVCGIYNVNSTMAASDPSFVKITYVGVDLYYRKWELVGVDLTALIGQNITIEFETSDCQLSGHFGYAYIDADCGLLNVSTSYCSGESTSLMIAPGGFQSYQWSGPNSMVPIAGATDDSLALISPIIGDTFNVTMQSASGCITTLSAVIDTTDISIYDINVANSCPGGSSGSIAITPQGTTSGYTYLWSPGGDTTATITDLAPGIYSVHIESVSGNCGAIDTSVTVGVNPVIASVQTVNYCDATTALIIGPTGNLYQWYNPSLAVIPAPTGTNDTLIISSPVNGNSYTLAYNTTQGCRDSIIYTLNFTTMPGILSTNNGSTCGSIDISYLGSSGVDFDYLITTTGYTNFINDTSATAFTITGLLPGTYTVTVNDNGCVASDTISISLLVNSTSVNFTPCPADTLIITNATTGIHDWSDPNGNSIGGTSGTLTITSLIEGTYVDTVTTASACIEITDYIINFDSIAASSAMTGNNCYGDNSGTVSVIISTSPPSPIISWNGPTGFTGLGSPLNSLFSGMYVYTINAGNCIFTDSVYVTGPPLPGDTLQLLTSICGGDPTGILYAPLGYTNYQWYFGSTLLTGEINDSIVINNTSAFEMYNVTYDMPPFGCNYHTTVILNNSPAPAFIPSEVVNIFTPNGDGLNENYYPFKSTIFTPNQINDVTDQFSISIYNRWGTLIYESSEYLKGWDGKRDGKTVDSGVYFIHMHYIPHCARGDEQYEFHTTIHVVR